MPADFTLTPEERKHLEFARRVYNEMPCACGPIEKAGVCACPIAEAGAIITNLTRRGEEITV